MFILSYERLLDCTTNTFIPLLLLLLLMNSGCLLVMVFVRMKQGCDVPGKLSLATCCGSKGPNWSQDPLQKGRLMQEVGEGGGIVKQGLFSSGEGQIGEQTGPGREWDWPLQPKPDPNPSPRPGWPYTGCLYFCQ